MKIFNSFSLVNLQSLSEEEKEDIIGKMNETVQARVYLKICESLQEDERTVMDEKKGEELLAFLDERGFNLANMVMEEALKYRLELATLFQVATTPYSEATALAAGA